MISPTANTRLLALLGRPVAHSFSPVIQNAAFREADVDGVYVALRCEEARLPGFMRGLGAAGAAGNITLPHKEKAASVLDVSSEAVRRTGACNTFWCENGSVCGDNTDVEGFRRALQDFLGDSPTGFRVLLLGAGGAACAVLLSLLDDGVDEVLLMNRSVERARTVARRLGGVRTRVARDLSEVENGEFDLVVNTTPLGLSEDDSLPIDLERLSHAGGVMDLVYGPHPTRLVRVAEHLNIRAVDGGEMLVQQGAVSFERWWAKSAPIEVMRRALKEVRSSEVVG